MKIELDKEELKIICTCLSKDILTINSYRNLVNKTTELTNIEKLFNKLKQYEDYR